MAAIGANARLLSNDVLARDLLEKLHFRMQLAQWFPFFPITGHRLRYACTDPLQPAGAIDFGGAVADDTSQPIDPNANFGVERG